MLHVKVHAFLYDVSMTYSPFWCVKRHLAHPVAVEFSLAARVLHEVHLQPGIS